MHQDLESCYNQIISWYVPLCVHYLGNHALPGPLVGQQDTPGSAQQFVKMFPFEEFDVWISWYYRVIYAQKTAELVYSTLKNKTYVDV